MSPSPSSQPFDFSGSIVRKYDQYSGPLFFEPYAIEVASRIDSSSIGYAVELASGTGRVTRHLRKALRPEARLIASDISADMLAVAREKLEEERIEWQMINAEQLPFEDNSVDLLVCCFGYMFVSDKVRAFAEAFRVLKPGSMLILTTWDKLESLGASQTYRKIVKKYLTEKLPESFNLPYSMCEEAEIKQLLRHAGFSKISIERVAKLAESPTALDATIALSQGGPIYNEIMKRNPAWYDEIKVTLERELSEKYGVAPMIAPMSAIVSQAWK